MVESHSSYKSKTKIWYGICTVKEQYQFLFKYFSSENQWQNFSKETKTLFLAQFYRCFVVFTQREFLLKNLTNYNCSDHPTFKCQRYRVDWLPNQKLFYKLSARKTHSVNSHNSSSYLWITPGLRAPSIRSRPILTISTE